MSVARTADDKTGGPGAGAGQAVRIWLLALAVAVVAMVAVGGATRLTDSGLSITEWKPVTGAIPPLSEAHWLEEFAKYQQIPEYEQINKGMSLEAFKEIYWWEWGHRFLGRLVGVLFVVPFVYFLLRGRLSPRMVWLTLGAFALGGLQGAVGWWMVTSGLSVRTDVSQYRLAAHLGVAVVIFAYLVWLSEQAMSRPPGQAEVRRIRATGLLLPIAIFLQIILGAFVAGMDAGLAYPTWPLMDGHIVPGGISALTPWWLNAFENVAAVQFNHRMVGYAVFGLVVLHALDLACNGRGSKAQARAHLLALIALAQVGLGISAILYGVPLLVALAHQVVAIGLFGVAVFHADALWRDARTAALVHA